MKELGSRQRKIRSGVGMQEAAGEGSRARLPALAKPGLLNLAPPKVRHEESYTELSDCVPESTNKECRR